MTGCLRATQQSLQLWGRHDMARQEHTETVHPRHVVIITGDTSNTVYNYYLQDMLYITLQHRIIFW